MRCILKLIESVFVKLAHLLFKLLFIEMLCTFTPSFCA
jgi:hypothetical protein